MDSGGDQKTETISKQDNTPWGPAQPYLLRGYQAASDAYDATPKTAYQGPYIAPQSQATLLAQTLGTQLAGSNMGLGNSTQANAKSVYDSVAPQLAAGMNWTPQSASFNPATYTPGAGFNYSGLDFGTMGQDYTDYGAGSDYMSQVLAGAGARPVNNSPDMLNAAITAAIDPVQQQLLEKILPQAKLNAVGSGVYGGDANGIDIAGLVNDNYTRNAQNIAAQLGYQDFVRKDQNDQEIYKQTLGISADASQNAFNRQLQDWLNSQGLTAQQNQQKNALGMDAAKLGEQQAQFNTGTQLQNNQQQIDANNAFNSAMLQKLGLMPGFAQAQTNLVDDTAKNIEAGYGLNALPIDTLTQIGQQQDKYSQAQVEAWYKQWQDLIMAPWQGLEQYTGAIKGYPTSSTGSSTSNTTQSGGGLF